MTDTHDLDSMFGIVTVAFDTATIKIRRVLTRKQARTVADVMTNSARMQRDIAAMDFSKMADGEAETAARKMEDDIAEDLVRGCTACIVNADELNLGEWSIPSLTQLFSFVRDMTSKTLTDAMTAQFPQSGSRA
ncbi:MAG TPA: hypothetical protein PLB92_03885 [Rhodoglobus sp.]|nr:hypothetical protein [Rhodoglobus sp.]